MRKIVISTIVLLFSLSVQAKVIQVLPGHNTLQPAFEQAINGDTVVLVEGNYTTDGYVQVTAAITLRSISPEVTPVVFIDYNRTIQFDAQGPVTVQGVHFASSVVDGICSITFSAEQNHLINNRFSTCSVQAGKASYVVGNGFYNAPFSTFNSVFSLFGSNTVSTSKGNGTPAVQISGAESYLIGNTVSCLSTSTSKNCSGITVIGNRAYVVANRINHRVSELLSFGTSTFINMLNVAASQNYVSSNLVHFLSGDNFFTAAGKVQPIIASGISNVVNNVVYVTGDMAEATDVDNSIGIRMFGASVIGDVQNNIVANFPGTAMSSDNQVDALEFKFNLCYNNKDNSACDAAKGNLIADPLFVDTTHFILSNTSPAINTGNPVLHLSDLNGSRADMGIHGGKYGFSQYDVQRAASDNPYIYPLFSEVNLTKVDEVTVKAVSIARFK